MAPVAWRTVAKQDFVTHLRSRRSPWMALAFTLLFVAAGQAAGQNRLHQLADYNERVNAHRGTIAKYENLMWLDSGGLYVDKAPSRLAGIVRGLEGSFGTVVRISRLIYPNFSGGMSDSPLVSVFFPADFLFIFKVIASLCALLLSFDAIVGEREAGTLRLLLSTPVSRLQLYVGKCAGTFAALLLPLTLGFAAGILTLQNAGDLEFTAEEYARVIALWCIGSAYVLSFVTVGVLISTLARSAIASLSLAIVSWLVIVVVAPPMLVAGAARIAPRPSLGVADAQIEIIRQEGSQAVLGRLRNIVETTRKDLSIPTIFFANRDEARHRLPLVQQIREDYDQQSRLADRAAHDLTMLSPAGALTHLATRLAGTGFEDFERYLDEARRYKGDVLGYFARFEDRRTPFDAGQVPPFDPPQPGVVRVLHDGRLPGLLLLAWLLIVITAGIAALSRYDPS